MSGPLRARGSVVDALSSALDRGGHGLSNVPTLLRRLLEDESWREFETLRGEVARHQRFADFVTTPPLKGLGGDIELLRRIVQDDPVAVDLLDRALQNPASKPAVNNVNSRPVGNRQDTALRRLRKDRPDLHAEVLAGNLSAHAAMVEAGFRHRTISVPVDQPDAAAKALKKNLTPEDLAALAKLLQS